MKEKIEQILTGLVAGIDVASPALVDEGYITSITMIQLVCELDIAFDIQIDFASITKENFNSVEAIEQMVKSFQARA